MSTEHPGHPYANSAVATYLSRRIDELRGVKTQREIAAEAGFAKPNIISMMKVGETKLALDRIPALAKALDADAGHLFACQCRTSGRSCGLRSVRSSGGVWPRRTRKQSS